MTSKAISGTVRAVLIEDSKSDLKDVREELEASGGLSVTPVMYKGLDETTNQVTKAKPDVILIDFRLVKNPGQQDIQPTQGSTLAALFKEKARMPDTPVFLVSLGRLSRKDPLLHIRAEPRFFDDLLIKEEILKNPKAAVERILGVVVGYGRLSGLSKRTRKALFELLGAGAAESDSLMKSEPPVALVRDDTWDVTEVAQWIRHTLMAYPGILYDGLTAACFVGLSLGSFGSARAAEFFAEARYGGPFCEESERWWKSRLLRKATEYMLDAKEPGPPMAFGQLWRKKNRAATLSRCNSSGEEPADCVCCLLLEPVRREYTLRYFPDRRPSVMDEARVSFKAVRQPHRRFDPGLVSPEARSAVAELQKHRQ